MFIYAETLIELAIRIGIQDLQESPEDVRVLLGSDPALNQGLNLTPPGSTTQIFDPTLMDKFQAKVAKLKRIKGETGLKLIFHNPIPDIPDINAYLATANLRFVHGYPRETQDLPCIAITLGAEDEGQKYFGVIKAEPATYMGQTPPQTGGVVQRIGSDFDAQYQIHVLSTNYDETIVLYHLIRYALLKYRDHLEGYGLREATMHWQDCEPAAEYLQAGIFTYQRTCVLSLTKDESFVVSDPQYTELYYGITDTEGNVLDPGKQIIPGEPETTYP